MNKEICKKCIYDARGLNEDTAELVIDWQNPYFNTDVPEGCPHKEEHSEYDKINRGQDDGKDCKAK